MNVNGSFFDIHKFILLEVLVRWKFVSGSHVLRSHDKLLRTIVFGADLQDEVAWGRLPPNPPLTLIFLQQERFCWEVLLGPGMWLRSLIVLTEFERGQPQRASQPWLQTLPYLNL